MKNMSQASLDALERGEAIVTGAVEILSNPPVRVWGGFGAHEIDGNIFDPLGDRDIGITLSKTVGAVAQNISLSLSGIEPEVLALLDASELQRAPVVIWQVVFDQSGETMLDATVHSRGRVDRLPVREKAGGTATITVEIESAGRGLGRKTGRMRSDADQRLIDGNDGGMRRVSFAGERKLYWGGRRPSRAGDALPGSGGAAGGSFGRDRTYGQYWKQF